MGRDLREYAKHTNVRLIIGWLILVFLVGDGLIYLFYGRSAALSGLLCLLVAMVPLVLTWMFLLLLDWVVNRAR